jgi:tetratricopeptide (TPR) repeat protein
MSMALTQRGTPLECIRLSLAGRVAFFLAFSLAALSVEAGWSQETVIFAGQIRSSDGHTIPSGVNLRLETAQGMLVQTQPANPGGQFEFTGLRKEPYHLTVTAEGFQTLQQELDLSLSASRVFINLFLAPVGESKTEKGAAAALTDQQAPKRAREEYAKGVRAFSKEKYSDAGAHFEKAITGYPCYARAQTQLAVTLIDLGEPTQAESALRKSIECDPGYYEARLVLGQLLNMQKRFEESEKVLLEGVRLAPGSWQFYYHLGIANFGLGEYAKAGQEYQKVLSLNPTPPPDYHVKVADVYLAEKAYDKAYTEMQAYLQTEPSGRFADKIRRIIQEMEVAGVLSKSKPNSPQAKNE